MADEHRCSEFVIRDGQCRRKGTKQEKGHWYCTFHLPSKVKNRREQEKKQREAASKRREVYRKASYAVRKQEVAVLRAAKIAGKGKVPANLRKALDKLTKLETKLEQAEEIKRNHGH